MRIDQSNYQLFCKDDVIIRLNGIPQYNCVEVDTDEGWIKRLVLDADMNLKVVDGEHQVEQVFGVVTVEGELQ
jgi:hypothetical protein